MDEAFKLGDKVAIMRDGRLIQVDTPEHMSSYPADDYVNAFIRSADKSQVLSVGNIMMTPTAIIKEKDPLERAIHVMRQFALSTVYVVDNDLHFCGMLSIQDAVEGYRKHIPTRELLKRDVRTTTADVMVADIMPVSAETPYPLAVIDEEKRLVGIVTKASVLSSLI